MTRFLKAQNRPFLRRFKAPTVGANLRNSLLLRTIRTSNWTIFHPNLLVPELIRASLIDSPERISDDASIVIIDNRDDASKKTKLSPNPICSKWYGDQFIQPSKLEYLKHQIEKIMKQSSPLSLTLKIFETIEYCEYSSREAMVIATEAAVLAATGMQSYYQFPENTRLSENTGGDFFG